MKIGDIINLNFKNPSKGKPSSSTVSTTEKVTGKQKKKIKEKMVIPKSVQDTIPYLAIYKNGIIKTAPCRYSKTYLLEDVNFSIVSLEEQENIFARYEEFLNMFSPEVQFQISIFNRRINKEKVFSDVLLKHKSDNLDFLRDEMNDILMAKLDEGKNNLTKEKYLTVNIESTDVESAFNTFLRLDVEIASAMKKINNREVRPMTIEERLNLLYDVYNMDSEISFTAKTTIQGHETEFFNLDLLKTYGISSKDVIGPSSIRFNKDHFYLGDKLGRVLFLDILPSFLTTDFLTDITDNTFNVLTSIQYESIHQDRSMKMLKNQLTNINSNIIDSQKKASKAGYSGNLISPALRQSQQETEQLIEEMTSKNQKLFFVTLVIVVFADDMEELNKNTNTIISAAGKYLVSIKKLNYQQEPGLTTALPLATNKLSVQRMLTTQSAGLFIPFTAQELAQKNGLYYGLNAVSRNLILYNRSTSKNTNGIILGTPGSGKSFAAKREMLSVLLNTDADVFVIDPDREYTAMAELLNGEIVRIAAGSDVHINPFDMNTKYGDTDDPITLKSDFIGALCETIIGGRYGLSPMQKSVIDRCVRNIYQPYMEYMFAHSALGEDLDSEHSPTMVDFYNELLAQPEIEAKNLALALELYSTGSLDTFAHHTNVNTNKRFVVYDIKDIGTAMKELGLQVCLNDIWNKTIANKQKGKRTWFYVDEFHVLTQTESSAQFLQQIFKRARKWGGCPTGITQNVEDMLSNKEARTIISNCDFIMMLNQSPIDGAELAGMLNISATQMSYITNATAGQGLLYTGTSIIPFIDNYPTNTQSFKVMTSKFEDVVKK